MLNHWRGSYGDIYGYWIGSRYIVVLSSYELIYEAFINKAEIFSDRPAWMTGPQLISGGRGVIFGNGPRHGEMRKFTVQALREFGVGKASLEAKIVEEANSLMGG